MDRDTFLKQVKGLAEKQSIGFKLDDLLGTDISCEGLLGDLVNDYGEFILSVVSGGREISESSYEKFWSYIVNPDNWSDKDIEDLYEELTRV